MWRQLIILLLTLLFTSTALGQSDIPAPDDEIVRGVACGIENGRVIPGDGTICREDIAFGMLYAIFPSLFEEMFSFWRLTEYSNAPGEHARPRGAFHGDDVFFVLFDLFYKMVIYCIILYLFVIALSVLIRWIRGESITENNASKDSLASWAKGALIGGSFLLPVKGFFVGQIVVFTLGVLALYMANMTYSVILSGNQTLFGEGLEPTRVSDEILPNGTIERHDYLSENYMRYLVRMQLCRMESASYQLSGFISSYETPEDLEHSYACAMGDDDPAVSDRRTLSGTGSFVWSHPVTQRNGLFNKYSVSRVDKFSFEARPRNTMECRLGGETALNFHCGSVTINSPDWSSSPLIDLLDDPNILFNAIDSIVNGIHTSMSPGDIQDYISSEWDSFREVVDEALIREWRSHVNIRDGQEWVGVDDQAIRREDALRQVMMTDNRELYMRASQMFHQEAMNALMFPHNTSRSEHHSGEWHNVTDTDSNFSQHWISASEIARLVSRVQCVSNHDGLLNSAALLRFFRGEIDAAPSQSMARCLDLEWLEVKEYNSDWDRMSSADLQEAVDSRRAELSSEIEDLWKTYTEQLAGQRRAIERSFANSMRDEGRDAWWSRLRQQGYLSAGDYAQVMNNQINNYRRSLKLLVNNFSVDPMFYDDRYISEDLMFMFTVDGNFPEYSEGERAFIGSTTRAYQQIDPLVGSYHWVSAQEAVLRQPSLNFQAFDLSDMLSAWGSGGEYLDRLGIDLFQKGRSPEACLEDPEMCPFPLTDPVVELSLMGHDMLDMAIQFYAVAIPMKVLGNMATRQNHDGSIGGVISKLKDSFMENEAFKTAATVIGGVTKVMGNVVDFLYGTLSGVMGMFLALGAALAYLLPLIPKIYLYMGFISWFMVLVMASFSVLLLSLFWVRFKEKRDLVRSALAHYGIELLFKPTFNLIAVFFAVYFFYVIAFIIGMTLGFVINLTPDSDSIIMPYIETLIVLLLIVFVYILGLRYIYQLMDDLSGEILERLGVQNKKVKDKASDLIKAILFDAANNKSEQAHNKLGNIGKKNPQKMADKARKAQDKSGGGE